MLSLSELNPQQREAVTTTNGPVLLLAGAGSGKTRVIIHRIAYLVQARHVPPESILAVTFTNKAANEMQERLKTILKERRPQISTFHALGVKILRQMIHLLGYRSNFIIYDAQDQLSLIKHIMDEQGWKEEDACNAKTIHYAIGQAKNEGKDPQAFLQLRHSRKDQVLGESYRLYQTALKGCNAVDFDDILLLTLRLFQEHSGAMEKIRQQYQYLMVDEYQDTNRVQYQLLLHLSRHHRNLCVVGDDDQSIYGWRGADIRNILDFKKDFPETITIKLEQNYRSTQTILDAANQVITHNQERMPKKLWSHQQGGEPLEWLEGKDEVEEMEKVVHNIRLQMLKYKRQYADYTILFRSNFQSRVVEEALREKSIPYRVVGTTSFYDRKEIKDAIAYLRLVYNPADEVSLHRIINYPKRGIGQTSLIYANAHCRQQHCSLFQVIKKATTYTDIPPEAARSMEQFTTMIQSYQERLQTEPLPQVFEALLNQVGLIRELEKEKAEVKTRERRIACVYELLHAVSKYVTDHPESTLKDFLERIMLYSLNDEKAETEQNQVTLMTLHSAKGLEFPYVFIVGMAEGIFPHKRALTEGGEDEERRLCYVGITRAQKGLTLSMSKERKRYGESIRLEPSRFVSEIDPQLFSRPFGGELTEQQKQVTRDNARKDFFLQLQALKS